MFKNVCDPVLGDIGDNITSLVYNDQMSVQLPQGSVDSPDRSESDGPKKVSSGKSTLGKGDAGGRVASVMEGCECFRKMIHTKN